MKDVLKVFECYKYLMYDNVKNSKIYVIHKVIFFKVTLKTFPLKDRFYIIFFEIFITKKKEISRIPKLQIRNRLIEISFYSIEIFFIKKNARITCSHLCMECKIVKIVVWHKHIYTQIYNYKCINVKLE